MTTSRAIAWLIKLQHDLEIEKKNFEFETISITEKNNHVQIKRFLPNGKYITNEIPFTK